jgi:hypothetical protein
VYVRVSGNSDALAFVFVLLMWHRMPVAIFYLLCRCIWELHMLFVSSGAHQPDMDVVDISDGASEGGSSAAALYSKLAAFRLEHARCYDPNEVRAGV